MSVGECCIACLPSVEILMKLIALNLMPCDGI